MTGKYFALALLLLGMLAKATAVEPECPLLKCQAGSKVACFIDHGQCQCSCVTDDDPCASLRSHFCPPHFIVLCSTEGTTCKCRCSPLLTS
uniref:Putative conserved secreted protein n=1 Tax=Amblyomma tuberculatum TaxID=48802 RepID=A0A6M2E2F6_9ACAR